jgi:release factor glutamine methyltransferase
LLSPQFSMLKSSAAIRRKADPPEQTLFLRVPLCPLWLKLAVQLKASLGSAIARLTADQVPSPRLNAELLLTFTLNCDRAYLFAHPERELSAEEQTRYDDALSERARGVPAQYITGHQEFWGMDLIVTPAVLIPRPETEHIVETVLAFANDTESGGQECPPRTMPLRILDVGTGSGCLALALATEFPNAEIHATDISAAALEVARANAARHQFEKRIHFHQADLLKGLNLTDLDFVISNPPYVGEAEEDQVQLEVRKYEPRDAVFAGPTGVEVIARLLPQAHAVLRPGAWLILEISGTIAGKVERLLDSWDDVRIMSDLQSIPRVVQARKPRV